MIAALPPQHDEIPLEARHLFLGFEAEVDLMEVAADAGLLLR